MAKMTLSELSKFTASYVTAAKQAGAWKVTTDNYLGLVDKIGKQITITGSFEDDLPELNGDDLPYGRTIEEYMINLIMPVNKDDGVSEDEVWDTYKPTVQEACYSYTLGKKKIAVVEDYNDVERAALGATEASDFTSSLFEKFETSYTNARLDVKERLLGNAIEKLPSGCVETLVSPTDTESGSNFLLSVKKALEIAKKRNEGNCVSGTLIGGAKDLILAVKQGIMPEVEINTLMGAIHDEYGKFGVDVKLKIVDSFGTDTEGNEVNAYAFLFDARGIKLHNSYNAVRSQASANKDKVLFVRHYEDTGFISKYTYMHAWKAQ